MRKVKFMTRIIRFDLYNPNKIYIYGVISEGDAKCKNVLAKMDTNKVECLFKINKGNEIKERYKAIGIYIDEEIVAEIELPENWKEKKQLNLTIELENDNSIVWNCSVGKLKKLENIINYNIDAVKWVGNGFSVQGWAISNEDVRIDFLQNGKKLEADVEWIYRKDVMNEYSEVDSNKRVGIKAIVRINKKDYFDIKLYTSKTEEVYKVGNGIVQDITKHRSLLRKVLGSFRRFGVKNTLRKIKRKLFKENAFKYEHWIKIHEPNADELNRQRNVKFGHDYKFSIVIPLYRTPLKYLDEMVDSILNQTYSNWELCLADGSIDTVGEDSPLTDTLKKYTDSDKRIKFVTLEKNLGISENTNGAINIATGDFIVFGDHDDLLAPNALYECAKVMEEKTDCEIIYTDEDKINMSGKKRFQPHFKSDFNLDLLCSINYICHLFVVKRNVVEKVGLLNSEFDGAQDHDFILRCVEQTENIYHIPKILYHWRCHENSTAENPESKLYAFEAGKNAVTAHYKRIGIPATTEMGPFYGTYRTIYHWKEKPLVSIIIPNKDHIGDLEKCIRSIEKKSTYRNYEFIIVENNSCEETFEYYKKLQKENSKVKIVYYEGDFNYSAINNLGVKSASGEYLLLLNNDTEIINADCISELLGYCMRDDVGIVGAKLYYNDNTVQHGGVVVGFGGIAGHTFIGFDRGEPGYFARLVCAQDYSAVTAACMMTKKTLYEKVGGLTEAFKVAFNDVDYCMKIRKLRKLVVFNPYAELYHYESKSRGMEDTPEKIKRFQGEIKLFEDRWSEILKDGDPYYNCNLSLDRSDFGIKE